MTPRLPISPAAAALTWRFVLVLVAGAAVAQVMMMSPADPYGLGPTIGSVPRPADPSPPPKVPATALDGAYPLIAAHPLFYPSRMPWIPPPPPKVEPVVPPPSPLTSYIVVGVIVSDETRSALVKPSRDGKSVLISEGQDVEGWTLKEITRERLRFTAGDAVYDMIFPAASDRAR